MGKEAEHLTIKSETSASPLEFSLMIWVASLTVICLPAAVVVGSTT